MATEARLSSNKSECSDEYFDTECSPCLIKNKHTEGDHYCMECQDYYCSKCVAIHKDFPALSNHTIVGKCDSKYKELVRACKHVPTERCHHHKTKLVDMYCTVHKKVGCSVCMSLEHTSCKLLYVPDAIDHIMSTFDLSKFTEDCRDLKRTAIERIQVIEKEVKALSIKKDYAMKDLKEFKNALRNWLDIIEESAIKNLDNECAKLELKWTDEISKLRKNVNELEQYEAKLKAVTKNESQKFVCTALGNEIISATVKKTEETLQKLKSVSFTPTLALKELLTSRHSLGTSSLTFEQECAIGSDTDILHSRSQANDQKCVVRSDTSMHNMTSKADDAQQKNELYQQRLIAQLKVIGKLPTHGPELAKLMFVGARVVPGNNWIKPPFNPNPFAYTRTNTGTGIGTVVSMARSESGYVQVTWDKGGTFEYRMGFQNMYDLKFAD